MKKSFLFLLISLAAAVLTAAAPATMTLTAGKKANFRVVTPDKPDWPTKLAADDIVRCVREAAGARVKIVPESKLAAEKEDLINFYVGLGKFTEQFRNEMPEPYGCIIKFPNAKTIVIAGRLLVKDNYNTLDGVTYFLEKNLGVYNLMPGDLGTVIPKLSGDWQIQCRDLTRVPSLPGRQFSGGDGRWYTPRERSKVTETIHWNRRMGMTVSNVLKMVHNVGNLIDPEKYAETHPEFFPLIDGKRRIPPKTKDKDWKLRNWEPCYTAPGIAGEAAKNVIEFLKHNPNLYSCSLAVNDSGNICRCETCCKVNAHLSAMSESQSYYEWVNQVVKLVRREYPECYFGILNYWATKEMPEKIKLDPKVVPLVCEDFKIYVAPKYRERLEKRLRQWDEVASTIGWWDYGFEADYLVPAYNASHSGAMLKELYKNHNLRFYFNEWSPGRYWKNVPEAYMLAKLAYDIDRDPQEILNEWFDLAVGKQAAPYLKDYFRLWEDFWTEKIPQTKWFINRAEQEIPFLQRRDGDYLDALDYDRIAKALSLLDKAVELAPEGKERKRAEFFRDWFAEACDLYYLPYINSKAVAEAGARSEGKLLHRYGFDGGTEAWKAWQRAGHTAKLVHDPAVGHDKAGSLKLDRSDSLPTSMVFFRRPLDFELQPGKNYRFRVWTRAENLSENDYARMVLYFPCSDHTELGRESKVAKGSLNMPVALLDADLKSGEWRCLELCLAVPENAWQGKVVGVNCQLEARVDQNHGKVWFDDFSIEELPDAELNHLRREEFRRSKPAAAVGEFTDPETGEVLGPEMIMDGDMESSSLANWAPHHNPKVLAKSTDFAKSGKQSLHLVAGKGGAGVLQIVRPTHYEELFKVTDKPLTAGKEYRIEVWVKNMVPERQAELRLPGSPLRASLKTEDQEWRKFVFRVKTDKVPTTPYIVIGYSAPQTDCYIDDLSVREIISPGAEQK